VIDAENFVGYEDTSVTARMQAQYTDIILVVCAFYLGALKMLTEDFEE
jgi:hypothetical protein